MSLIKQVLIISEIVCNPIVFCGVLLVNVIIILNKYFFTDSIIISYLYHYYSNMLISA